MQFPSLQNFQNQNTPIAEKLSELRSVSTLSKVTMCFDQFFLFYTLRHNHIGNSCVNTLMTNIAFSERVFWNDGKRYNHLNLTSLMQMLESTQYQAALAPDRTGTEWRQNL